MDKELMEKYQQAISLLQFRNPGCSFSGSFHPADGDKVLFTLYIVKTDEWKSGKKAFKPMDTKENALRYFIKASQNLVLKNMFNN